jgi:hypothetical protein
LILAVDRLAALPVSLGSRLATWLEAIWLGPGFVPDLGEFAHLRGRQVRPDSPGLWDLVPGCLYGRHLVIGTGPHLAVDLTLHEIAHAVDRMDGMSDRPDWQTIVWRCGPVVIHPRYREPGELYAESWAHCALGETRRLTRMLSGRTELAETIYAYHRAQTGLEAPRWR